MAGCLRVLLVTAAILAGAAAVPARASDLVDTYRLSAEELREVQRIVRDDTYFATVNKRLKNIEAMMKLLSRLPSGPARLALKWNQGTWNGFTAGIKGIEKISNLYTCGTIMTAAAGVSFGAHKPNIDFWNDLYVFRNCP